MSYFLLVILQLSGLKTSHWAPRQPSKWNLPGKDQTNQMVAFREWDFKRASSLLPVLLSVVTASLLVFTTSSCCLLYCQLSWWTGMALGQVKMSYNWCSYWRSLPFKAKCPQIPPSLWVNFWALKVILRFWQLGFLKLFLWRREL